MKTRSVLLGTLCFFVLFPVIVLAQTCDRTLAQRDDTAERILEVTAADWDEVIWFFEEDMSYRETVAIIDGRSNMYDYFNAMFTASPTMDLEVEEFLKCIDNNLPVTTSSSADALKVMKIIDKAYADTNQGKGASDEKYSYIR